jgi:glutamate synthase domain-containing protein 2
MKIPVQSKQHTSIGSKRAIVLIAGALLVALLTLGAIWQPAWWILAALTPILALLIFDLTQRKHTILRNYPVFGHLRYFLEDFRTQIRQYFIQSDIQGEPFIREQRAIVYMRAKNEIDSHPFGTLKDVYAVGFEWLDHSLMPVEVADTEPRISIGGALCAKPYVASRFNISAMSFGSLSSTAIEALNLGASLGGFAHNTGEGGISKYHLSYGADLVWEIGTGYFGRRTLEGNFDAEKFAGNAGIDTVRMVEIKLSQGAKPGGGGILPGGKVTGEIAAARGVPQGKDVRSPAAHSAFSTPLEMMEFIARLRTLSGGKPVGFKLCIGSRVQFLGVVKAMLESGIRPDFITIDGKEGGTGAAELELSDGVGRPLREGLIFAHNALVGAGLRDEIRLICSGKIVDGLDIAKKIAIGADICNSARGMMFALGCIQARVCNKNICPTGITTQDPWRVHGLVVSDKGPRVARYHEKTIYMFQKVLAACGLHDPRDLHPGLLNRRVTHTENRTYAELFDYLESDQLLNPADRSSYSADWRVARPDRF